MRIELDRVKEKPFSWNEEIEIAPDRLSPDVRSIGPVSVEGTISWVHPGFLVRLRLDYEQTLSCVRCLEDSKQSVEEEVALVVLRGQVEEPEELELEEEDLNVVRVEGDELDTEPLVVEQVQLQVPMKPLCDPECEGLCPRCGAPRSEGCECETATTDPRWAALEQYRDR